MLIFISSCLLIIVSLFTVFLSGIGSLGGIGHPLHAEDVLFMRLEFPVAMLALGLGIFGTCAATRQKYAARIMLAGTIFPGFRAVMLIPKIFILGYNEFYEVLAHLGIFVLPCFILSLLLIWGGWKNKKSGV